MQRALNRIMRTVLDRGPRDSVEKMMEDLDWLSVKNQFEYRTLFWMRKADREVPTSVPFLRSHLELSQTTYSTRRFRVVPDFKPQTIVTSQAFCHRAPSLYSSYDLYPDLSDWDDYKELIRWRIIERNGNKNI